MANITLNKPVKVPAHLIPCVAEYQKVLEKANAEIILLQTAIQAQQTLAGSARAVLSSKLCNGGVIDAPDSEYTLDGRYAAFFKEAYVWVHDPAYVPPAPNTMKH